jgi:protein TonB
MSADAVKRHPLRRKAPALMAGGLLLLFTAGVIYWVIGFVAGADKPEAPRVQKISLVKPPPPKPPEVKPPEPEKIEQPKEEVPVENLEPKPEAAAEQPAGEDLAVEGEGGAGSDGFGLVGKKNVQELTSGGGDREAWYGRLISRHFEEGLRRSKKLQGNEFRLTVLVWFDSAGAVRRLDIERGSGDAVTDEAIKSELLGLRPLREVLPDDLPQPVKVQLLSRA